MLIIINPSGEKFQVEDVVGLKIMLDDGSWFRIEETQPGKVGIVSSKPFVVRPLADNAIVLHSGN